MATMRTADSWQKSGGRYERPPVAPRAPRPAPSEYRAPRDRAPGYNPPPVPSGPVGYDPRADHDMHRNADYRRGAGRDTGRPAERQRPSRRPEAQDVRSERRPAAAPERGGRVRGIVAILLVFLVTLAGAAADSFIGVGLGKITLVALVGSTALATLVVRRRDILSVVVAPPLIFVAVALANIAAAPSAALNLPTVATLLIRGFPAMGIATGVALLVWIIRTAAGR